MAADTSKSAIDQDYEDGMKVPNADNWLVPDKLAVMTTIGLGLVLNPPKVEASEGGALVTRLGQLSLTDRVPKEVRKLFAAAKGAMCYGYLFYPLYAISEDRLYLAVERAVKIRSIESGGPKKAFADAIGWLCKNGFIERDICILLGIMRKGRNEAMHAEFQTIVQPQTSIRFARRVGETINILFADVDEAVRAARAAKTEHKHDLLPS